MRVAETRAVNRALRKAYGIGLCSVEELGVLDSESQSSTERRKRAAQFADKNGKNNENGSARVRDRLCQLIRQHQLDPDQVKAHALDFCGVKALKDATRTQVEIFIEHLGDCAAKNREALICQLNSYPRVAGKNEEMGGAA
jgi:hypothetical protein